MARIFMVLLQLTLILNSAVSKSARSSSWHHFPRDFPDSQLDLDHFAHLVNEPGILRSVHLKDNERKTLHLDMHRFFEKLNKHVDHMSYTADHHPLKMEDAERIHNLAMNDEKDVSKLFGELMNLEIKNELSGISDTFAKGAEDYCPVGNHYTYFKFHKELMKQCYQLNFKKIAKKMRKYRLTTPAEILPKFPEATQNLKEAIATPVLNQPSAVVVVASLFQGFKDYNMKDPLKITWPFLWLGNAIRNKLIAPGYLAPGNVPNLTTYDKYAEFLEEYRQKQKQNLFGIFPVKNYIKYALAEDPYHEDITRHDKWKSDEVFTQQRLAGLNPMSLRKANLTDFSKKGKDFNWDDAIRGALGKTTERAIEDNLVFIVEYPLLEGIDNAKDIESNDPNYKKSMRKAVSPIAVFVSVMESNKTENTLKPLAIQMDRKPEAPVFTPNNGTEWMMAKAEVQKADIIYVQIVEHLLKTHLLMEPICVIMHRTFSKHHPLYQLLQPHCKYLSVTNSVGLPSLFDEKEFLQILFSIGNTGAIDLLNKAYGHMSWNDTDFAENLKNRGVMDNKTLPYFPYRDDGLLLWDTVGNLAKEYVDMYYPEDIFSISIVTDIELQSFALQLKAKNLGKLGSGRFKDFPSPITERSDLVDVVKRILFIPIQHSAINYPISYYGAFTPNMATKLYDTNTNDFSINSLPSYNIATYQLSIAMVLGSIRYDKIFDYSEKLKDDKAKALIKKYYNHLHGKVNNDIIMRNKNRGCNGQLMYPYFMPQYLTNSIQT